MQGAYSVDVIPVTQQASTVVRAVLKGFEKIVPKLTFFLQWYKTYMCLNMTLM
jgi:hypothetical protein